jgi:hypothetical protein
MQLELGIGVILIRKIEINGKSLLLLVYAEQKI